MAISVKQMNALQKIAFGMFCSRRLAEDDHFYGQDLAEMVARQPKPAELVQLDLDEFLVNDSTDQGSMPLGGGDSPRCNKPVTVEKVMHSDIPKAKSSSKKTLRQRIAQFFRSKQNTKDLGKDKVSDDALADSCEENIIPEVQSKDTKFNGDLPFGMMLLDLSFEDFLKYKPTYRVLSLPFIVITPPEEDAMNSAVVN